MKSRIQAVLLLVLLAFGMLLAGSPRGLGAAEQQQEVTVYITKSGKKYHRSTCSYLSKSKTAISLKDAKAQGYTPCSRCKPPQ